MASDLHAPFRLFASAIAISVCSLAACSASDDADGDVTEEPFVFTGDCATVKAVPTYTQLDQGILTVCRGCHTASLVGDARQDATPGVDFDSYDLVYAFADSMVLMVQNKLMPPPSGAGPTDSQKNQLYAWAACGKPR